MVVVFELVSGLVVVELAVGDFVVWCLVHLCAVVLGLQLSFGKSHRPSLLIFVGQLAVVTR